MVSLGKFVSDAWEYIRLRPLQQGGYCQTESSPAGSLSRSIKAELGSSQHNELKLLRTSFTQDQAPNAILAEQPCRRALKRYMFFSLDKTCLLAPPTLGGTCLRSPQRRKAIFTKEMPHSYTYNTCIGGSFNGGTPSLECL